MSDNETPARDDTAPTETVASAPTKEPKAASAKPSGAKPEPRRVAPYAVFGGGATDTVSYSAVHPPKPSGSRKVLSVLHTQRRLAEAGFLEAQSDKGGFYGALTTSAVGQYQESLKHPVTGKLTREEFTALFEGDVNTTAVVDTESDNDW